MRGMDEHERSRAAPSSYPEIIDVLESLPVMLRETRRRKGLSLRQAAEELDVSFSSVTRWERGQTVGLGIKVIVRVLRWIAT
jgi:DNA-binding transcriptional regulator YiaG